MGTLRTLNFRVCEENCSAEKRKSGEKRAKIKKNKDDMLMMRLRNLRRRFDVSFGVRRPLDVRKGDDDDWYAGRSITLCSGHL